MNKATVLVAGATGIVGREVTKLLRECGYRTRALSRNLARAQALRGIADDIVIRDAIKATDLRDVVAGVEAVVSCLGAPVSFTWAERRGFHAVDTVANTNLVRAAKDAGVTRVVYVGCYVEPGYAGTAYARAHERVVEELRKSGLSFGVVRPTGIFPAFDPFILMARSGMIALAGDGTARSNPVHPLDVAEACVAALARESGVSIAVGGPDVLTRDEIARLAFQAVGKSPRIIHSPPFLASAAGAMIRPFHPHTGELLEFISRIYTVDCVAPQRGSRRLAEHFAQVALQR